MKGRMCCVVLLCQVIALSALEPTGDVPCPCAKAAAVGRTSKTWTQDNLDKLKTWISRVVGSLKQEELDGPVVVLPLVINGDLEKTLGVTNTIPETREAAETTAPAESTPAMSTATPETVRAETIAPAETTAPAVSTATPYTLGSSYITVPVGTVPTVATTLHVKDPLEACIQPKDKGPCKMIMRQFYYNATSGDCSMFIYGGCRGNDNRFSTRRECLDFCSGVGLEKVEYTVYTGGN